MAKKKMDTELQLACEIIMGRVHDESGDFWMSFNEMSVYCGKSRQYWSQKHKKVSPYTKWDKGQLELMFAFIRRYNICGSRRAQHLLKKHSLMIERAIMADKPKPFGGPGGPRPPKPAPEE